MGVMTWIGGEQVPATQPYRLGVIGAAQGRPTIRMRCPVCRHQGTLESGPVQDINDGEVTDAKSLHFGLRRCPNPECHAVIFVVGELSGELLVSYPPEVLDFDATNLPTNVLASLSEAITCHAAGAYRAAALMVRRTLEDVCADRGAEGDNLKQRLAALRTAVVVPAELLAGLDDLRLLGNDAAHVELTDFDDIGEEEAELAIQVTKELLKGVYQYADLVRRLAERKRTP